MIVAAFTSLTLGVTELPLSDDATEALVVSLRDGLREAADTSRSS